MAHALPSRIRTLQEGAAMACQIPRLAATGITLSLLAASPASADPIRITSGTLDIAGAESSGGRSSPLHLVGDRGFTLDGSTGDGVFEPGFTCEFGCNPGDAISLDATWSGLDLHGRATLDGLNWEH